MGDGYDYSSFPSTPGAGKYSMWVPGQDIPRQPGFSDWLFNGLLTPFGSGFRDKPVPDNSTFMSPAETFAQLVDDRAQWQARQDAINQAKSQYLQGTGPFKGAPSVQVMQDFLRNEKAKKGK